MGTEQLPVDNDTRLVKIETKVDQIHLALCGDLAGTSHGLHARVAKLEAWAKWLATVVTALVIAAVSQVLGYKGLR